MSSQGNQSEHMALSAWDPKRLVRRVDSAEARLSRGFLRCRPEKWFPGFAAQWLPLSHSLGIEVKIVEIKPQLKIPPGLSVAYACSVDDEPLGIFADENSAQTIIEAISPGANPVASSVVGEYLARRLLSSLVAAWSGPESSVVRFETEINPSHIHTAGAIKCVVEVNKQHSTVWIAAGKILIDRLDGLWRRQIRSVTRASEGPVGVHLEVAQLAVPPAMLADYLKAGTVIDLEIPVNDQVTLRMAGKPWLPARLCQIGDSFGFEVIAGPVASTTLPEGTTRLSITFGSVQLEAQQALEVGQIGAMWDTGIAVSDVVNLVINSERVSEAQLCSFEGRFALSVL